MKFRITTHYDKETGSLLGYSIAYKPFLGLPGLWLGETSGHGELYKAKRDAEHDICFIQRVNGDIKERDVYE